MALAGLLAMGAAGATGLYEDDAAFAALGVHLDRDIKVLDQSYDADRDDGKFVDKGGSFDHEIKRRVKLQLGDKLYTVVIDTGMTENDLVGGSETLPEKQKPDLFGHAKSIRMETGEANGTRDVEIFEITDQGLKMTEQKMEGDKVVQESSHVLSPDDKSKE